MYMPHSYYNYNEIFYLKGKIHMKHLLKMLDLTTEEITEILDLADQLKYELNHGIPHPHLKGKTLGMIFQKASTVQ